MLSPLFPPRFCFLRVESRPACGMVGPFNPTARKTPRKMKTPLLLLALALTASGCTCCKSAASATPAASGNHTIFLFSQDADLRGWEVQDDVVMGGRSQGRLALNEAGNAVFTGNVSLANDGGFSSIQYGFDPVDVTKHRAVFIGLKGDGKRYQLRVESEKNAPHGYAYDFETSGDWEVIRIPFADMYAIHHDDRLDLPNYPGRTLAHIQILIGNDKAEAFQLELDRIWVK